MKTFLKVLLSLFVVLMILVLGGIVFLLTFDLNSYKPTLERQATEALGRTVQVENIGLDWSFVPQIEVKNVVIQNPTGFEGEAPFFKTESVRAHVALMPLFKKKIEVRSIEIGKTEIALLEKDGKVNWQFGNEKTEEVLQDKKDKPAATQKAIVADKTDVAAQAQALKNGAKNTDEDNLLANLRVDDIAVEEIDLSYSVGGTTEKIVLKNLTLKQLRALAATVIVRDKNIRFSANLDSLLKLIQQKPDYAFNAEASLSGLTLKVSGTINNVRTLTGLLFNITLSTSNLRQAMIPFIGRQEALPARPAELKAALQGTPNKMEIANLSMTVSRTQLTLDGNAILDDIASDPKMTFDGRLNLRDEQLAAMYQLRPFSAEFKGRFQDKKIHVDAFNALSNRSDITFTGDIDLKNEVPHVSGKLMSEYLDMADIVAGNKSDLPPPAPVPTAENQVAEGTSLLSNKQIDFSALKKVNAHLDFTLQNIQAPEALNSYLGGSGSIALSDGVLDVHLDKGTVMSGDINGTLYLNAAIEPEQLKLAMKANSLHLNDVRMMRPYVQNSLIDLDLTLETTGNSPKAFADALSGKAVMEVTGGTIVNKWFNSLPATMGVIKSRTNALSFSSSDQESKILCGAMNLNIKDGVITSDKSTAIEANTINFVVGGHINLKDETVSLSMIPSINSANAGTNQLASLLQILKISGPFTKPQVSLDVNDMAKDLVREGVNIVVQNLLKKQEENALSESEPYAICCRVLGKKSRAQIEQERVVPITIPSAQTPKKTQPEPQQLTPQQEFKQQLLEGLSKALKQ